MSEARTNEASSRDGPEGIGGWMFIPAAILFLLPVIFALQIGALYLAYDPTMTYAQDWSAFEIAAWIGNAIFYLVLPVLLIRQMLKRKARFPNWYVAWALAFLAFLVVVPILQKLLFGFQQDIGSPGHANALMFKTIVNAAVQWVPLAGIWVPYMMRSLRVRNTFVNS